MAKGRKKLSTGVAAVLGVAVAALAIFLIWLSFQPVGPAFLPVSSGEDDPAESVPRPISSQEETEASQPETSSQTEDVFQPEPEFVIPQPVNTDQSLDTLVDWAIWYALNEPQFPVREDGTTVYGERFGDPYAQWCAEFLLCCVEKAEQRLGTSYIKNAYPWYPSAYSCGLWFKAYYHYFDAGTYTPARGDMVMIDSFGSGYPDHAAMVMEVKENEKGETVIVTIEGNILTDKTPQIRSRELLAEDEIIMGYGSIRTANWSYAGPIDYYSAADAPTESEAEPGEESAPKREEVSSQPNDEGQTVPSSSPSSSEPEKEEVSSRPNDEGQTVPSSSEESGTESVIVQGNVVGQGTLIRK